MTNVKYRKRPYCPRCYGRDIEVDYILIDPQTKEAKIEVEIKCKYCKKTYRLKQNDK